jgi:hypothetical protein
MTGRRLDEMPSQAVANCPYAVPGEKLVILRSKQVVLRARKEIKPATVVAPVA